MDYKLFLILLGIFIVSIFLMGYIAFRIRSKPDNIIFKTQ